MDFANHIYKSSSGTEHKAYVIGHIFDELNTHGGSLGDMVLYQENKDLHEIFGYNLIGEKVSLTIFKNLCLTSIWIVLQQTARIRFTLGPNLYL